MRMRFECFDIDNCVKGTLKQSEKLESGKGKEISAGDIETILTNSQPFFLDHTSLSQGSNSPDWLPFRGRLLWSGGELVS